MKIADKLGFQEWLHVREHAIGWQIWTGEVDSRSELERALTARVSLQVRSMFVNLPFADPPQEAHIRVYNIYGRELVRIALDRKVVADNTVTLELPWDGKTTPPKLDDPNTVREQLVEEIGDIICEFKHEDCSHIAYRVVDAIAQKLLEVRPLEVEDGSTW
jgi:hypothetical protein